MRFHSKFLVASLGLALLFAGCERDLTPDGPSLSDLYGTFKVKTALAASLAQVDFSSGQSVYFTAETSISTDFILEIKGRTSGAVKRITGKSRTLDATNALWQGETSQFPTFQTEICDVQLTFPGYADTLTTVVTVTGKRLVEATILDDFEGGFNPSWTKFIQTGANMQFSVQSAPPLAEGTSYYRMGGTVAWDWLIGMYEMPKANMNGGAGFQLSNDAEKVFFNGIFRQMAGLDNAIILLQLREDDNGDGTYSEGSEDLWAVEIRPESAWELMSFKYSDLVTLV
ncbi:MAG: hypothetical protein O3A70_06490, partial [Bacteroidetes bacterium]|nr:hypothetical protein [Bacteroidota bacterium]